MLHMLPQWCQCMTISCSSGSEEVELYYINIDSDKIMIQFLEELKSTLLVIDGQLHPIKWNEARVKMRQP